jgi:hypothetical protein
MSEDVEFLMTQADRCSRLAGKVTDLTLAKTLRSVAADYLRQAIAAQRHNRSGRVRSGRVLGINPTGENP